MCSSIHSPRGVGPPASEPAGLEPPTSPSSSFQNALCVPNPILDACCGLKVWEEKEACKCRKPKEHGVRDALYSPQADTLSSLHTQLFHMQSDAFLNSPPTGLSARTSYVPRLPIPKVLSLKALGFAFGYWLCSPFIFSSSFTVLICSQPALPAWQLTAAIKSCRGRCFPSKGTWCFPCWTWERFPLRELICAAKSMQLNIVLVVI